MRIIIRLAVLTFIVSVLSVTAFAGDVTIETLCASASENNLELLKLEVESRQAEIDRKNAEAAKLPSVDFQAALTYLTKPMIEPITLTAGELGAYDIGGSSILLPMEDMTLYSGMENTNYDFKFILDQPIFTWGKINNAISLYSRIEDSSQLVIESKSKEIRTGISIYFYSLFYITEIEESLQNQIEDSERLISIAEESYNNGFILYAQLLETKIQAKKLEIAAAELNEQKEQALLSLAVLSGKKELKIEDFNFDKLLTSEDVIILNTEDYMASAFENSPEVKMLNELREINELRVDISRGSSGLKPDIGLHIELGYSGPRFPFIEADWFGQDSLNLTSTIAVKSSIYDGGKPRLQIERDLEELEKTYFEYEAGLEKIKHVITESILKLELNRRNIEYFRLLQENDILQYELKKTQFEAGSGDENDMLAEKINLNIHRIDEYRESIEFFKNYFSLINAASSP